MGRRSALPFFVVVVLPWETRFYIQFYYTSIIFLLLVVVTSININPIIPLPHDCWWLLLLLHIENKGQKRMQVTAVSSGRVLVSRQKEHRDRIRKINLREPGTSVTLDNLPPDQPESAKFNPRKISIKMQISHNREQDNK